MSAQVSAQGELRRWRYSRPARGGCYTPQGCCQSPGQVAGWESGNDVLRFWRNRRICHRRAAKHSGRGCTGAHTGASRRVTCETVVLLTPEDVDAARLTPHYRAPGR